MRRLIVNADDFGLTSGVNRAIVHAHEHGIVTSATLMANARAAAEAVQLVHSLPRLSVGCHVALVNGRPIGDPAGLSNLADPKTGELHDSLTSLTLSALAGNLRAQQVKAEASAQIRWLQSNQIEVSHIDAHQHTHILPVVLNGILCAARACGVRAVRNPFEPAWSYSAGYVRTRPALWKRYIAVRSLRVLRATFLKLVGESGLVTTDGTVGIVVTGALNALLFRTIIEHMPEGTWEFVCHPGYEDEELRSSRTQLHQSRVRDLALLSSPEAREVLDRHHVELISYRNL